MITPRQAFLTLEYDGKDISSDIRKDVENFTYTDSGSDSSDSLSIKVNAMDHKWIDSWMPDKEAVLHPTLCTTNWIVQGDRTVLDCGTLVVDDLSFSACPDVLTIGAVARPNGTSFHEKNREQTEAAKNYNGGTVLSSWQDGVLTDTGTPLYVLPPRDTGRTLSEIPVSAYQNTPVPGGNGGSSPQFVFAPNITITGDADRQQIASIMEDEYEKFKAFMDKYNRENNRTRYA